MFDVLFLKAGDWTELFTSIPDFFKTINLRFVLIVTVTPQPRVTGKCTKWEVNYLQLHVRLIAKVMGRFLSWRTVITFNIGWVNHVHKNTPHVTGLLPFVSVFMALSCVSPSRGLWCPSNGKDTGTGSEVGGFLSEEFLGNFEKE